MISQNFRPLDPEAEVPQAEMTQIFASAVAAARKESALPVPDINHLLLQAAELSIRSRDDPRRQSLLKMMACVLNKESNDANVSLFVDSVLHDIWTSKPDYDRRKEALELISWVIAFIFAKLMQIAKALVLRTHAKGYELLQLLIELLQDEKWGIDAAKAFQTISSEDDILNKLNHAVIRLLHKQRFFMFVFPKIVDTANSLPDDSRKSNFCVC